MKFSEINKQTATEALSNNRMFSNLIKDNDMFFEKIIDYSRSHKHFPDHLEKEDIKQELYISFLKALKKFRTESKCKFSTFAWTVLNNDLKLLKNKNFKTIINEKKVFDCFQKDTLKTEIQLLDIASLNQGNNSFYNLEKEIIQKISFEQSISEIDSLNSSIMELKIRKFKMKQIAQKLNLNFNTLKWIYKNSTLPLYRKAIKDSLIS